ncbi:MAG: hypothetical protein JO141_08665 [Bradyrhizobium sp.]|nr:hypothetical protein [Bradyrhizobium sp.]
MTLPVMRFWRDDSAMANPFSCFCRSNEQAQLEFQGIGTGGLKRRWCGFGRKSVTKLIRLHRFGGKEA